MGLEIELLQTYEKSLKEGTDRLFQVPEKREPQVGQIREMWSLPVERFLVLEEAGEGLFLTVPLTSYLQLLPESAPVYELRSHGLRLGVVPVWDYLRKELIENCSQVLGRVSPEELLRVKSYVLETKNLKYATRKFIKLNSRRWAKWTMHSLLAQAEKAEREEGQFIRLTPDVERELSSYRTYALAAENRYFRGERYISVLKERVLRLYLPVEMVGRLIRVLVGSVVIYEGELESVRLDIEGDFSGINLQEELKVVEL
ncbi:MAG: hypothetical protein ACK42C_06990 [Aquificaceae bacterium]|jgi:hypothetical protein|uniref:hypothetical protein n=1 Tax=Hydrogenobacter sp. Uz 6-8 TaxID=3384828 RepID=UPI0030A56E55